MLLNHVAFVCSSETLTDKFYNKVLGLKKIESKVLSASLSKKIFDLDKEYQIIKYGDDTIQFEIFLTDEEPKQNLLNHICLKVKDLDQFLKKCNLMGVEINKISKGESILIFVKDFDGNLFEIKERRL
ncbi:MAG: VOC family protein [Desulfobacterales bacterium]|nr:VOC family protein [Desulfobacterales bacterium]MBF0396869.1 VOC family protein [Desulfobacterales bacterium]